MQPLNPHRTGATITSVIASPRTRGKGGSYPSAPLILPPGSKMCCEAIAQSSTSVWRDVPFPPTRWLSVLRMQKEQRGTQCKLENPRGGAPSPFSTAHTPQLPGDITGVSRRAGTGGVGTLPSSSSSSSSSVPVGFLCPRSGEENPYQRSLSTPASPGASTCAPMLSAANLRRRRTFHGQGTTSQAMALILQTFLFLFLTRYAGSLWNHEWDARTRGIGCIARVQCPPSPSTASPPLHSLVTTTDP